jgi:isopenicillin-N N-acyltransferase like protein
MPCKKHRKRRILLWLLTALLLTLGSLLIYFAIIAIDHPPRVTDQAYLKTERKELGQDTYGFGNNWLRRSESGLWEAYIEGNPFERGVAFGQLTRELLYYQETTFIEQIRELVPSESYLKVLKYFIAFFNRNLDKNIPEEYREEIYGTSFACSPEYDFIGSGYQRQLNYHAAHDIGHALQELNLVACTSFSVWDSRSGDSSLLLGRNFDFYMGEKFAENKIVCFVNPSRGYKFMMITWPDLIGVVSGMNEKGLTVTINASKSSIPRQAATPVTILAREILQYAANIEDAYKISGKRRLFVSESIMVGSAIDHKTAIIEKSPDNSGLFYSGTDRIICTNHFQGDAFANDEINLGNIRGSDSYMRFKRVEELIDRAGKLEIGDVAAVLRDQRTLGDKDAGMGNQQAVNQLIAHHSVIFKPDSLQVWVSTAPWQLGKYVAYDLRKVFNLNLRDVQTRREICTPFLTLPADTFLNTAAYSDYRRYQLMTAQLRQFKKQHQALPDGFTAQYIDSNPMLYLTYVHLGEYYNEIKAFDKAFGYYSEALGRILPGKDEEARLRKVADELYKKSSHADPRN